MTFNVHARMTICAYVASAHVVQVAAEGSEMFQSIWDRCPDGCVFAVVKQGNTYHILDLTTTFLFGDGGIECGSYRDVDVAIMSAVMQSDNKSGRS